MEIKKIVGWGGGGCRGDQSGCERRSDVLVKIKKKIGGEGSGRGRVRVDVNEELKFLCKLKKKSGGGRVGGGQGGCERRIEVVVEMQKKIGGGGGGQVRSVMGGRGVGVGR